jgi:hypothetical protein
MVKRLTWASVELCPEIPNLQTTSEDVDMNAQQIGLSIAATMASIVCISGSALAAPAPGTPPVKWVHVPGAYIRADCVHSVPNDATVDAVAGDVLLNGARIAHHDACPEPPVFTHPGPPSSTGQGANLPNVPGNGGWVEAAEVHDTNAFFFDEWNYFNVPYTSPSLTGGLIFWFNSLQSDDRKWIIQPVLQWGGEVCAIVNGTQDCWGGPFYTMAAWLVGPNGAYASPPWTVGINNYDQLWGGITSGQYNIGNNDQITYHVVANDNTAGLSTSMYVNSSGLVWDWVEAGVVEAYNISNCSQFPSGLGNSTVFYNISVTSWGNTYSPNWQYNMYANSGVGNSYSGPNCNFGFELLPTIELRYNY